MEAGRCSVKRERWVRLRVLPTLFMRPLSDFPSLRPSESINPLPFYPIAIGARWRLFHVVSSSKTGGSREVKHESSHEPHEGDQHEIPAAITSRLIWKDRKSDYLVLAPSKITCSHYILASLYNIRFHFHYQIEIICRHNLHLRWSLQAFVVAFRVCASCLRVPQLLTEHKFVSGNRMKVYQWDLNVAT